LIGPLEIGRSVTKKVRTVRQKKSDIPEETGEEISPEELAAKKQKKDADQLSQAERNFIQMRKILEQKSKASAAKRKEAWDSNYKDLDKHDPVYQRAKMDLEKYTEVDAVQFLMNPKSFTQTVENIFNASFLVKKGEAKMKFRKPSPLGDSNSNPLDLPQGWVFGATSMSKADKEDKTEPTQCVMSFTMADWRRLCQSRNLQDGDGDLPHRKSRITRDTQSQNLSQDA
jgi:hypothetical protein